MGAELDLQVRRELLRLLERDLEELRAVTRSMAVEIVEAWEAFRTASG